MSPWVRRSLMPTVAMLLVLLFSSKVATLTKWTYILDGVVLLIIWGVNYLAYRRSLEYRYRRIYRR